MPGGSSTKLVAAAFFLLLSVRLAGAQQAPAAPAPPTNDDCVACHGDPTFTRANGTPIFVDVKTLSASKHGALACVDCHADLAKTEVNEFFGVCNYQTWLLLLLAHEVDHLRQIVAMRRLARTEG